MREGGDEGGGGVREYLERIGERERDKRVRRESGRETRCCDAVKE